MTTPDKPMQGLADFLRASAYHAPIMSDASAETLRQWAADVDAAQASSVTEPVGGGVVAALRELANVVSIHLGLGTIPGSYGPGLKGMAMSEWIRKALHASLEKSVVALSTHEATQREGGGTVSGAAEAVPVASKVFLVATGIVHEGEETYTRHEDAPPPMCDFECLFTAPPKGISASEAAPGELDPRTALETARKMRLFVESFNGQTWGGIDESVDRKNLATALDNLDETSAMLLNMAERIATPPPAPQPPNANCPVKCESMEQCSGACDFMEAAQPAVVEALPLVWIDKQSLAEIQAGRTTYAHVVTKCRTIDGDSPLYLHADLGRLRASVRTSWMTGVANFRELYDKELFAALGITHFQDLYKGGGK